MFSVTFLTFTCLILCPVSDCYRTAWNPVYEPNHHQSYDHHYHTDHHQVQQVIPSDVMVDVINNLGLKLLAIHNEDNDNNIALSPYGALSMLVVLGEGLQGDALHEIQHAAHLPTDISVVRVGLRDIHRHLKSYFIPKEGFLAGLTLNHDNVSLNTNYEDILKFYGFDIESFNNALYPDPLTTEKPDTTTVKIEQIGKGEEMPTTTDITTTVENITTEAATTTTMKPTTLTQAETSTVVINEAETTVMVTTESTETSTASATTTSSATTITSETISTTSTTSEVATTTSTTEQATAETSTVKEITTEEATTMVSAREIETTTVVPTSTTVTTDATTTETTVTEASTLAVTTTALSVETTSIPSVTEETVASEELNLPTTENTETTTSQFETTAGLFETTSGQFETTTNDLNFFTTQEPFIQEILPTTEPSAYEYPFYGDATVPPTDFYPDVDSRENLVQPDVSQVNGTTLKRSTRSVVDYIIAKYYDNSYDSPYDYHEHRRPAYIPDEPLTFLAHGKYRESAINFMVYDTVLPFLYVAHLNALALSFPLDNTKYYLLLLLPLDVQGVDDLVCDLRLNGSLKFIINNLKLAHVKATIPSFMLKGYVILTPTLQKLGIKKVFEPRHADFSPMTSEKEIYVTNIEQAVTVTIRNYVDIGNLPNYRNLYQYQPVHFKADHPFLYFVIDADLHVALMAGKIVNPLNSRVR